MKAIFDKCMAKRTAVAARRKHAAEIIGVIAREHGAKWNAGRWSLTCPNCGETILIEEQGFVATSGQFGDCPAAPALEKLIKDALRGQL